MRFVGKSVLVGLMCVLAVGLAPTAAFAGSGTMLVKDADDCSGNGNSSTVTIPFSLYFTGFDPFTTGTVTAYTQPGGVEVASAPVQVDGAGNRCVLVEGDAPPGQYKIVYDFGSGTGKQKVIRVAAAPTATPTSTPTATPTATPTSTPTETPTDTATSTPTDTTTSTSTDTATSTPTDTATGTPTSSDTATSGPGSAPSATAGDLVLTPLGVVDQASLPATGGTTPGLLPLALALTVAGLIAVVATRTRPGLGRGRRH